MKSAEMIKLNPYAAATALIICLLVPYAFAEGNGSAGDSSGLGTAANITLTLGFDSFPANHTCDGRDASPAIEIEGSSAASLALIVEDPEAPSGTFYHWLIWNIQGIDSIAEGIAKNATIDEPFSAVQGTNSFGEIGYDGPCPPAGKAHRYFFRAYGLDKVLDLNPGSSVQDLKSAMEGHIVQEGEAIATYGR